MHPIALNLHLFFLILALVLAILAGLNTPTPPRINLGWFSFACFLIAEFFT
jgi:hypothetical protein